MKVAPKAKAKTKPTGRVAPKPKAKANAKQRPPARCLDARLTARTLVQTRNTDKTDIAVDAIISGLLKELPAKSEFQKFFRTMDLLDETISGLCRQMPCKSEFQKFLREMDLLRQAGPPHAFFSGTAVHVTRTLNLIQSTYDIPFVHSGHHLDEGEARRRHLD